MAEYEKKIRVVLKENGCFFVRRGKGDHDIWQNPANNKTFPVDTKIKSRHMANRILKEAGIDFKF